MTMIQQHPEHHRGFLTISWDAWTTARAGPVGITRRQQERLRALVSYARTHSPYLAECYRQVPEPCTDLGQLPVVTKAEMMEHFDDWMTDPQVKRAGVDAFIADLSLIGHAYLGRYVVCTTSGSTGTPAILVHDPGALVVYNVLGYIRSLPAVLSSLRHLGALLHGRGRLAAVFVTGGHFLGNTMSARRNRALPWRAKTQRLFSALAPLPELVHDLNAFQPVMLAGYPSALEVLAREQATGRLQIHPVAISAAGETLSEELRQQVEEIFHCRVSNYYGASEAVGLTFECREQHLHVNSDWYLLEPVDERDQPVPPGTFSHTVLLTNLANRVQPLIRYRLDDRVQISPDPCRCGSPFPVIQVIGRTDEILTFPNRVGKMVQVLPLALVTVAEETAGLSSCQLIQTAPRALTVRLAVKQWATASAVWETLSQRLTAYLAAQGIDTVRIEQAAEPPRLHPRSGKFQQVWSEARPSLPPAAVQKR